MDARIGRRQKRISKKQETKTASDLNGRTMAASGAVRLGGGADVRVQGHTRVECKYTENCSYTLKLTELLKLRDQAMRTLEEPVFQFQFRGRSGAVYFSYAVLRDQEPDAPVLHMTTSKQINLHEWDLQQYFRVQGHKVMRVIFEPAKPSQKRWSFNLMMWEEFLRRRKQNA